MPDHGIATELHELDVNVFESVAEFEAPGLDRTIPALSGAANYSRIWIAASAAIAAAGGSRGRRAAVMGLAAIGATSLVANAVVKPLARRRRPQSPVPPERRLAQPGSTSFPSGHTASAAAFSGVIGTQLPMLRIPLDTVAVLVGFSRVYTGVHYPGDVLAGWMLGRSVASAVRLVTEQIEARQIEARR